MLRYLSHSLHVIDNTDGFQLRCALGIPEYGGRLHIQFGALIESLGISIYYVKNKGYVKLIIDFHCSCHVFLTKKVIVHSP